MMDSVQCRGGDLGADVFMSPVLSATWCASGSLPLTASCCSEDPIRRPCFSRRLKFYHFYLSWQVLGKMEETIETIYSDVYQVQEYLLYQKWFLPFFGDTDHFKILKKTSHLCPRKTHMSIYVCCWFLTSCIDLSKVHSSNTVFDPEVCSGSPRKLCLLPWVKRKNNNQCCVHTYFLYIGM